MRPNPIYSPQNRIYFAAFVDGLDINYPVSREVSWSTPYAEIADNERNYRPGFFDFKNPNISADFRIAPWQKMKTGSARLDTELFGALTWDGPNSRWLWCDAFTGGGPGSAIPVYANDNFFTDEPTLIAASIRQRPYHFTHLLGRVSQPTASGVARDRLIWVEWPNFDSANTDASHYLYSANMDGTGVRQELRQSSTFNTSGPQTYRTIDFWTFNQQTGDIYVVLSETQANNGNASRITRTVYKLAWDRSGQRYNQQFIYGNTWTGSQEEPFEFIGQPTLSNSLDGALVFPIYDALSDGTPGHYGTFRTYNRLRIYSQSSLQQTGEIELPNPAGVIPDDFDPAYDENYPIGQVVAAWTSELSRSMFLWVGDNLGQLFPHSADQWEGFYEMDLDGSNMRKIAQRATKRDATLGQFTPSQNIFLGPGCYGAWECCT